MPVPGNAWNDNVVVVIFAIETKLKTASYRSWYYLQVISKQESNFEVLYGIHCFIYRNPILSQLERPGI